jgi:hypothetical protein
MLECRHFRHYGYLNSEIHRFEFRPANALSTQRKIPSSTHHFPSTFGCCIVAFPAVQSLLHSPNKKKTRGSLVSVN